MPITSAPQADTAHAVHYAMLPTPDNHDVSPTGRTQLVDEWQEKISTALVRLAQMANATEDEFLQVGSRLQDIYQRSADLSRMAERLVEVATGERIGPLIGQLRHILSEMKKYLDETRLVGANSCNILNSVDVLLRQAADPLESVKRMSRTLYMLEVSIKIESARLGDVGSEFVNLALDIKKLTQQIKAKAGAITDQRHKLALLLARNMSSIVSTNELQNNEVGRTLSCIETGLSDLSTANERFGRLGGLIATITEDNAQRISGVVQSMQFHDIFRQQVEHIIEALEGLHSWLADSVPKGETEEDRYRTAVSRMGDVCELQEAQLQFAAAELFSAVSTIVGNLDDISARQHELAENIYIQAGVLDTSGSSFIDEVSRHMANSTDLLANCARQNEEMTATMEEITAMVAEMTGCVADIEEIGSEIINISLNARIKANGTGYQGGCLSSLAEEIGQLSNQAVRQTGAITATLTEVQAVTCKLSSEVNNLQTTLTDRLTELKAESTDVLDTLGAMGEELVSLVTRVQEQVDPLTREIEAISGGIEVHHRTRATADAVLGDLKEIFSMARQFHPATESFRQDLRRMAEKYTMESERRIHEAISNRHGVRQAEGRPEDSLAMAEASESEFGDNVELF